METKVEALQDNKVKVTVTVWAGSQSESQTFYSDEVEA